MKDKLDEEEFKKLNRKESEDGLKSFEELIRQNLAPRLGANNLLPTILSRIQMQIKAQFEQVRQ